MLRTHTQELMHLSNTTGLWSATWGCPPHRGAARAGHQWKPMEHSLPGPPVTGLGSARALQSGPRGGLGPRRVGLDETAGDSRAETAGEGSAGPCGGLVLRSRARCGIAAGAVCRRIETKPGSGRQPGRAVCHSTVPCSPGTSMKQAAKGHGTATPYRPVQVCALPLYQRCHIPIRQDH